MEISVKFFFFLWSGNIGPSSVNRQNTSCLSDELVYARGSYGANRQMAKKVKLVGVPFVIQDARSQLK